MKNNKRFPKPAYKQPARALVSVFGRLYLNAALGVSKVITPRRKILDHELARFKKKETTLIFAFRHTAVEDAPALLIGMKGSHLRFLYGRDVLNWAGWPTRVLFPALGFVAVENRGNNREGADFLRREVKNPRFPLALAPEGQVSYHAFKSAAIEMGAANLASWALESERSEVIILPIALGYRYAHDNEKFINELITRWETEAHQIVDKSTPIDEQIRSIGFTTLALVNSFWSLGLKLTGTFVTQRDRICRAILRYCETLGNLQDSTGSIIDRLFRVRFKAEDILYNTDRSKLNTYQLAYHDLEVKQQHIAHWASQIVDVLEYIDLSYLEGRHTTQRSIEVMLSLLDVLNRLRGGMINSRFSPKRKTAFILPGSPIEVRKNFAQIAGRKERLGAIAQAIEEGLNEVSLDLEAVMLQST
ncbi:MAG: hypothetical protein WC954_06550 [Sphaerochaeta sp.]